MNLKSFIETDINKLDERVAPMVVIREILSGSNLDNSQKLIIHNEVLFVKKLAELQSEDEKNTLRKVARHFEKRNKVLKRWIVLNLVAIITVSFLIILF